MADLITPHDTIWEHKASKLLPRQKASPSTLRLPLGVRLEETIAIPSAGLTASSPLRPRLKSAPLPRSHTLEKGPEVTRVVTWCILGRRHEGRVRPMAPEIVFGFWAIVVGMAGFVLAKILYHIGK